jgi:putative RNA 2'-phosphotransferase
MDERRSVKISKYLSKHLRHRPERIGLSLDANGWADVEELLAACARHGFAITRAELDQVVAANDKQRYAFDETGLRIRANQGHSISVELDLPVIPAEDVPVHLFHGTVEAALESIRREGLRPMARHAVHLSPDLETARRVGARRGRPIVLTVEASALARSGTPFHRSANGVWLTPTVPPEYLTWPSA